MSDDDRLDVRPWSARRPQNYILSVILVLLAAGLVWQGLTFISSGRGGLVPFLILLGGPALAVYYIWYFTVRRFGSDETES